MANSQVNEHQIAELKAAGWEQITLAIWKAPNGQLYRGAFSAWIQMRKETQTIPLDSKSRAAGDIE